MTGKFRFAQFSTIVLFSAGFMSSQIWAQQNETEGPMRPIDRLALLGDEYPTVLEPETEAIANDPVPFSVSTMANDIVPPFAGIPTRTPTPATKDISEAEVSFEENMPAAKDQPSEVESIDDCCRELTEMIAGNLDSEISLDAKKRMIETSLKMIARNVALKAESKITKLKADHALEMARMQIQMGQMRSASSAVDQINRVAGPLSQILHKNYQQAVAMNLGNQQLSQALAQLGFQRLEDEARVARANRQRIQLSTPPQRSADSKQLVIEQLKQKIALLEKQQKALPRSRNFQDYDIFVGETGSTDWYQNEKSRVRPATYNQPLQPRRQPLGPLPRQQKNDSFDAKQYQQMPQWQR